MTYFLGAGCARRDGGMSCIVRTAHEAQFTHNDRIRFFIIIIVVVVVVVFSRHG